MKCVKCQSEELTLIPYDNFDYLLEQVSGRWIFKDPGVVDYYCTTKRVRIECLACQAHQEGEFPEKIYSPALNYAEITLDLDHTLFSTELKEYAPSLSWDLEFSSPDGKYTYVALKRPYLDKFLEECLIRFEKINFFTAAVDWYAQALIKSLNIPEHKLGYIKTRRDTYEGRPLSFDRELLKPMNNSLVVEDKPLVVQGKNNRIFKVTPFFSGEDNELLRILERFKQGDLLFSRPQEGLTGEIDLFIRRVTIPFRGVANDTIKKILELPSLTAEEMDTMPVRTSLMKSRMTLEKNQMLLEIDDLNYHNYLKLLTLLKGHSDHKKMTKKQYEKLLDSYRRQSLF